MKHGMKRMLSLLLALALIAALPYGSRAAFAFGEQRQSEDTVSRKPSAETSDEETPEVKAPEEDALKEDPAGKAPEETLPGEKPEETADPADPEETPAGESSGSDAFPEIVSMPARDFAPVTVGDVIVTVSAPAGAFPEGTILNVSAVEDETILAAVADAASVGTKAVRAVDITFRHPVSGEELQPLVPIKVTMASALFAEADEGAVVHVDEEGKADVVEQTADAAAEDEVSFEAESFSVYGVAVIYTVDFYYNAGGESTEYHLTGGGSMLLSELFAELGISHATNEIVQISFTDDTLVTFTAVGDDYRIDSLQPFMTSELLTIVLADGTEIIIDVEDAVVAEGGFGSYDPTYAQAYWWLDDSGVLTIRPKSSYSDGAVIEVNYTATNRWPWLNNLSSSQINSIKKIVLTGKLSYRGNENKPSVATLFRSLPYLEEIDTSGLETFEYMNGDGNEETASFFSSVQSMNGMCKDMTRLKKADLSGLTNNSNVYELQNMFSGCSALETVILNNPLFITRKSTNNGSGGGVAMHNMFAGCSALKTVDLSNITIYGRNTWTQLSDLFAYRTSLVSVSLKNTKAPYVLDLARMFAGCTALTSVDMNGFKPTEAVDAHSMFDGCTALASVDLTGFCMPDAEYLQYMFRDCASLETLDLSSLGKMEKLITMLDFVDGCTSLKTLDLSNLDNSAIGPYNEHHNPGEFDDTSAVGSWESGRVLGLHTLTALEKLIANNSNIWMCNNKAGLPGAEYFDASYDSNIYYFTTRTMTFTPDGGAAVEIATKRDYIDLITDRDGSSDNMPVVPGIPDNGKNINIVNGDLNKNGAGHLPAGVYVLGTGELSLGESAPVPDTYYRIIDLSKCTVSGVSNGDAQLVLIKDENNRTTMINTVYRNWEASGSYVIDRTNAPIKITYANAAIDVNGKLHDLVITINKITFQELEKVPVQPSSGRTHDNNRYVSTDRYYYRPILLASANDGLTFMNYVRVNDNTSLSDNVNYLSGGSGTWIEFTAEIAKANEGTSFAFRAIDLDVPASQDWIRDPRDACLDKLPIENVSYGAPTRAAASPALAEGFILGEGNDLSTVTFAEHTGLMLVDNNRVTGTGGDPNTSWSEFTVAADATGSKYTWVSGIGCATNALRTTSEEKLGSLTLKPSALKDLIGRTLEANEFSFELEYVSAEPAGAPGPDGTLTSQAANAADGVIEFAEISLGPETNSLIDGEGYYPGTSPDNNTNGNGTHNSFTYNFKITETIPAQPDETLLYDDAEHSLAIKISTPENDAEMALGLKVEMTWDGTQTLTLWYSSLTEVWSDEDGNALDEPSFAPEEPVFVNRALCGLTVSKTVAEGDEDLLWPFTVTLTNAADAPVTGLAKPEGYTRNDWAETASGVYSFTVKHGESWTITGIPSGSKYVVEEDNDGYASAYTITEAGSATPVEGTGASTDEQTLDNDSTVAFTNTTLYDLTIGKSVPGSGDQNKSWAFTLTLTDADDDPITGIAKPAGYTGTWTEGTDGVYSFTLKHGESLTVANIPGGSKYVVAEEADDDYAQSYTIAKTGSTAPVEGSGATTDTQTLDADSAVTFTNTALYDLTISKTVVEGGDRDKSWTFTLTLSDSEGAPITGLAKPDGFTGSWTENNGIYTFTLKHGESVTIAGIPTGAQYELEEAAADSYETSFEITDADGGIDAGTSSATEVQILNSDHTAAFTNRLLCDITISKTVEGGDGDHNKAWEFTLTLTDADDDPIAGLAKPDGYTGTWTESSAGVYTFTLKDGDSLTVEDIPALSKYSVSEELSIIYEEAYEITGLPAGTSGTGTGSDTGTRTLNADHIVAFTNTYILSYDLTIVKTVAGGDQSTEWGFTLTVTGTDGNPVTGLAVPDGYPRDDWTENNGVYSFTVKHGESWTINHIPADSRYLLEETTADGYAASYIIRDAHGNELGSGIGGSTGTRTLHGDKTITFTNSLLCEITIGKTVTGEGDQTKGWAFTLTLTAADGSPITGLAAPEGYTGTWTENNGVYSFTVRHGESWTVANIPYGSKYIIKETADSDYTVSYKITEIDVGDVGEGSGPETEVLTVSGNYSVVFTNDKPETPPAPPMPPVPQTGDSSNLPLYLVITGVSLAGIVVLLLLLKKKRKNERG